ncbi:hypothetical protein HXP44_31060 [Streptomyces sioyaensis]|uniref:Uncharacterized protein n=1 Tax=Streptomyces sioyaensis TaxID=67364 RepID=A0A4Q1QYN5_9ACTN|nr:hypothetical protein [Streptomyces sioyaensis]MBM4796354.1 hypothetical protein [Streptomyces sioyaensis]RXS65021.1 hypothetical protein EST54_20175 [Streptomyces sioyaensis]
MVTTCAPAATIEQANERIRAFMAARAGRTLFTDEQVEHERLLAAWAAATGGGSPASPRASSIS